MRIRTGGLSAWIFLMALMLLAADVTVGCRQAYVSGIVTQKFAGGHDGGEYEIAIDGSPHDVPMTFWLSVQVGDRVRYTGTEWQIVGRSNGVP
jgi:hypothetical protein